MEVIAGFSEHAYKYYDEDFTERLARIKPELLRRDFESELQREEFKEKEEGANVSV